MNEKFPEMIAMVLGDGWVVDHHGDYIDVEYQVEQFCPATNGPVEQCELGCDHHPVSGRLNTNFVAGATYFCFMMQTLMMRRRHELDWHQRQHNSIAMAGFMETLMDLDIETVELLVAEGRLEFHSAPASMAFITPSVVDPDQEIRSEDFLGAMLADYVGEHGWYVQ